MHYQRWQHHGDPRIKQVPAEIGRIRAIARFQELLARPPTDDCIETRTPGTKGRPGSKLLGRYRPATHAIWWLMHGADPAPLHVLHTCDNGKCLNPRHLFVGTKRDNARDMVNKGRDYRPDTRGERQPLAKLAAADVRAIRRRWPGERQIELAREFGVSRATICLIVHRKNWQSIP
jgi:HNH endonuclease